MMNSSKPTEDDEQIDNADSSHHNESDWVDYIVGYLVAIQRYSRISLLRLQPDRKEIIETRSTIFLPLAGASLALLIVLLLAVLQLIWPLGIAVLLLGSLELLFLRTFVPEAIPQSRELLIPQKSATSSGNIFVLTIVFVLLRMALYYHLLSHFNSILVPSILILISISFGSWVIPFAITFTSSQDKAARWVNPHRPLTKKQLGYSSLFLVPVMFLGFWAAMPLVLPAFVASALFIYWIMRKLGDNDAEITDTHLEGLASLFQIIFLLVCTIDFSFLKKFSE